MSGGVFSVEEYFPDVTFEQWKQADQDFWAKYPNAADHSKTIYARVNDTTGIIVRFDLTPEFGEVVSNPEIDFKEIFKSVQDLDKATAYGFQKL
jgi:hypothetical protein